MARAMSLLSTANIHERQVQEVMEHLRAQPDPTGGWVVARKDREVFVELATEDIPDMPLPLLERAARALGGRPVSRIAVVFEDRNEDDFEYRMVRAVAMAFSELWPIALDDHAGTAERIYPPGRRPGEGDGQGPLHS